MCWMFHSRLLCVLDALLLFRIVSSIKRSLFTLNFISFGRVLSSATSTYQISWVESLNLSEHFRCVFGIIGLWTSLLKPLVKALHRAFSNSIKLFQGVVNKLSFMGGGVRLRKRTIQRDFSLYWKERTKTKSNQKYQKSTNVIYEQRPSVLVKLDSFNEKLASKIYYVQRK